MKLGRRILLINNLAHDFTEMNGFKMYNLQWIVHQALILDKLIVLCVSPMYYRKYCSGSYADAYRMLNRPVLKCIDAQSPKWFMSLFPLSSPVQNWFIAGIKPHIQWCHIKMQPYPLFDKLQLGESAGGGWSTCMRIHRHKCLSNCLLSVRVPFYPLRVMCKHEFFICMLLFGQVGITHALTFICGCKWNIGQWVVE